MATVMSKSVIDKDTENGEEEDQSGPGEFRGYITFALNDLGNYDKVPNKDEKSEKSSSKV